MGKGLKNYQVLFENRFCEIVSEFIVTAPNLVEAKRIAQLHKRSSSLFNNRRIKVIVYLFRDLL